MRRDLYRCAQIVEILMICFLFICSGDGVALGYPDKPVKIVLPLPPGSGPDIRTRIIADGLSKLWGRQVVVENKPAGGGIVGTQAAISAPADGYTLLAGPSSIFLILPAQHDKLPFDVDRDLIPLGLIQYEAMIIGVSPRLGVANLAEFVAKAKASPGEIVIGTNPAGSMPHYAARLVIQRTSAPLTLLPYASGGTNEAIRDVIGGRVQAIIDGRPALQGAIQSGELKPIALMASERTPSAPGLPTASETYPGLIASGWVALLALRGTPSDVVARIIADLRRTNDDPEVQRRVAPIGTPLRALYGAELERFISEEAKLWRPMTRQ